MPTTAGELFYYYKDPYCKVPIFMSGEGNRCVLWIGGQSESFFSICYFQELADKLKGSWRFAQMELASSHIGFGAPDHLSEAENVDEVIRMLVNEYEMDEVAIFSTSTGLQVLLRVLESGRYASFVTRVIIHGIVAPLDNPFFTAEGIAKRSDHVQQLLSEGRKEDSKDMVGYYDIPVTASRFAAGGYLSLQEALWQPALEHNLAVCQEALHNIGVPVLFMIAHDAQYKPTQEELEKVRHAVVQSVTCGEEYVTVKFFDDTCDELRRLLKADIPAHVDSITGFLLGADEKRKQLEEEARIRNEEVIRQKRLTLNRMSVCM